MKNAFSIVAEFENRVAEYAGSRYAVAVDCCTSAIFLSFVYAKERMTHPLPAVVVPARTYVSVPMACLRAGLQVDLDDFTWLGTYQLAPFDIWDGAKRFRRGMYQGGFHCLSFHSKKILDRKSVV